MPVLSPGSCTIEQLIERAQSRGMVYKKPELFIVSEDGQLLQARYLKNAANGKRFDLTSFEEGEIVDQETRAAIERRLGVNLADH